MSAHVTTTLEELILLKADARGFSLLPHQPVNSLLAGRHASRLRGWGLSFKELRQYQQGDDVRTIDWKATARLRSPQVRVYDEERERPLLLVVDQRFPMFFGSRRAMKSVAAAETAALGAWRALDVGDRVGGIVFNDDEVVEIRPHRSQSRVLHLFGEIVRLNQQLASTRPPEAQSLVDAAGTLKASVQYLTADDTDVTTLVNAATRRSLASVGGESSRWQEAGYWLVPLIAVLVALSFRREGATKPEDAE